MADRDRRGGHLVDQAVNSHMENDVPVKNEPGRMRNLNRRSLFGLPVDQLIVLFPSLLFLAMAILLFIVVPVARTIRAAF